MQLPFTREAFFDLLAAYNVALWPAAVLLWLASALACASLLSTRRQDARWLGGLLAVHWAWSAIAYHAVFFTRINPAAWAFAAMFAVQAVLFGWFGIHRRQLRAGSSSAGWNSVAWALLVYALLYPLLTAVEHGSLLRIPAFAVPCPTTIFTAGILLLVPSAPRSLAIIPIAWSAIGGSAALLLGEAADYALPLAGAALAIRVMRRPTSPPVAGVQRASV